MTLEVPVQPNSPAMPSWSMNRFAIVWPLPSKIASNRSSLLPMGVQPAPPFQ